MTKDLSHLGAEDAANELARILEREGKKGGFDTDDIQVRPPEESPDDHWEVSWTNGPRNWGMYLSSGESIQFTLPPEKQWSQKSQIDQPRDPFDSNVGDPYGIDEPGFEGCSPEPKEPEIKPHGENWYLETVMGQNVLFVETGGDDED